MTFSFFCITIVLHGTALGLYCKYRRNGLSETATPYNTLTASPCAIDFP